ncbi:copper amine oxidase N-terminal domain-containing protein [Paenibacillus sp. P26]|nr:copper amine oxidase N-terminal domain-containing protein [Paenibacillus sp. P26]
MTVFSGFRPSRRPQGSEEKRGESAIWKYTARIGLCALLWAICSTPPQAQAEEAPAPVAVAINGAVQSFERPPVIVNGSTLVPLRAIFEKLGATVVWDQATRTVSGAKDKKRIVLTIDKKDATVGGSKVTLERPAVIMNGSTMVPARFVSESLGASVAWDGTTRTVSITADVPAGGQQTASSPQTSVPRHGFQRHSYVFRSKSDAGYHKAGFRSLCFQRDTRLENVHDAQFSGLLLLERERRAASVQGNRLYLRISGPAVRREFHRCEDSDLFPG